MNDTRRKLIDMLIAACEKYPDMRLGQIIANFTSYADSPYKDSIYDIEDDELAASLSSHLQNCNNRDEAIPA